MPNKLPGRIMIVGIPLITFFLLVTNHGLAQESNRAGVVIRLDESESLSRCVAFSEEDISGMELLERSGLALDIRTEGMGSLVCSINETGCPVNDCFCECQGGADCIYWSYWQDSTEGWQYARLGASSYRVESGEIQGWSWGPGSLTEAIAPPELTYNEICTDSAIEKSQNQPQEPEQAIDRGSILLFALLIALLAGSALRVYRRRRTP